MRSYLELLRQQAPPGPALYQAAVEALETLLADLYRRAAGQPIACPLPLRCIDSPSMVHNIFRAPERFEKNYDFLEELAVGRFSANGTPWRSRAPVTQRFYGTALARLGHDTLRAIYRRHLVQCPSGQNLFQSYVDAAVEAVSLAFGLDDPIPWPVDVVEGIRQQLQLRQAISWFSGTPGWQSHVRAVLQSHVGTLRSLWAENAGLRALLNDWSAREVEDERWDPAQELMQNMFAATETTASSLCWMVDALSRQPNGVSTLRGGDVSSLQTFIDETLRLFPPVPMVTRVCNSADPLGEDGFYPGEPLLISLVGLHCHPHYWKEPLRFWPMRPEWSTHSASTAYMPFLVGPRVCGGRKLAMAELQVGLQATLNVLDVLPAQGPIKATYALTSRPAVAPVLRVRGGIGHVE